MLKELTVFKAVTQLVSGSALSQVIMIVGTLALANVYGPEDFGLVAVYLAVVALVLPIATLRMDLAIIISESLDDAVGVTMVAFSALLLLCGVTFLVSLLVGVSGPAKELLGDASGVLSLVPFGLFVGGVYKYTQSVLVRSSKYRLAALLKIVNSIAFVATGYIGWLVESGWSLIVVYILSQLIAMAMCAYSLFHMDWALFSKKMSRKNMSNSFARHRSLAVFDTPTAVLDSAILNMPVYYLSGVFGADVTGAYSLAQRIVMGPLSLLAGAFSIVLLKVVGQEKFHAQPLRRYLMGSAVGLLALCVLVYCFKQIFAEYLVTNYLGAEWKPVLTVVNVLMVAYLIKFLSSCYSTVFAALNINSWLAYWRVISFLLFAIGVFYFGSEKGFYEVLEVIASIEIFIYSGSILMVLVGTTKHTKIFNFS